MPRGNQEVTAQILTVILDSFRKILVLDGYSVDTVETGKETLSFTCSIGVGTAIAGEAVDDLIDQAVIDRDVADNVARIAAIADRIRPDRIHLNTVDRPPAVAGLQTGLDIGEATNGRHDRDS